MKLLLDIAQGAGLAAAAGLRPFLPGLLAGALAGADVGLDFDGTDYAFLESRGFLAALALALAVTWLAQRRLGAERLASGPGGAALGGIALGLGALLFAGSLADHGYAGWPGLIAGLACAALAQSASRSLLARAGARLDRGARDALPLYAEGAAVALAGLAVLAPPVSPVALGLLAWLLVGGRRRAGEKYAGLRILR